MSKHKCPLRGLHILIFGVLFSLSPVFELATIAETGLDGVEQEVELGEKLVIVQENTLLPLSNPSGPPPIVSQTMEVVVTGYSSTVWETDETPFITAAGTLARDAIVANNYLAFGTKIRIPEIFGEKIFVVEDRMSWEKGNYHIDVWFPDYEQALNFGAKRTYIEILEG